MAESLYIHIPFCIKRCIYCDFVSGIHDPQKEAAYIEALKKEILGIPRKTSLRTLFIGGGTPTVLSVDSLKGLITHIFNHLSFVEDYEATIEANPGTLNKRKLETIRLSGVNRISIGIQSFNDDELRTLGRLHCADEAEEAVMLAGKAGFKDIGIDLIYGIPGQSVESWRRTVERAVKLRPRHISTYELTVENGTLLSNYLKNGKLETVDEEHIVEMYAYTVDYLKQKGFIHYEILNFAKPGFQCRHNLNYWNRGEYYGAGLGAYSFINGKRENNTGYLHKYIDFLSGDDSPVANSEIITDDKVFAEAVFLGLRKTEGIDLELLSNVYKMDLLKSHKKEVGELIDAGLLEVAGSNMRLTKRGLLLSNEVFVKFV